MGSLGGKEGRSPGGCSRPKRGVRWGRTLPEAGEEQRRSEHQSYSIDPRRASGFLGGGNRCQTKCAVRHVRAAAAGLYRRAAAVAENGSWERRAQGLALRSEKPVMVRPSSADSL